MNKLVLLLNNATGKPIFVQFAVDISIQVNGLSMSHFNKITILSFFQVVSMFCGFSIFAPLKGAQFKPVAFLYNLYFLIMGAIFVTKLLFVIGAGQKIATCIQECR